MMDPVTLLLLGVGTRLLGRLAEVGARSVVRWTQARWQPTAPAPSEASSNGACRCSHLGAAAGTPSTSATSAAAGAGRIGDGR